MTKGTRILVFAALAIILACIYWIFHDYYLAEETIGLVIYSSLLMLSFNTLIIEHYFTKPTDVIATSIGLLLAITPIHDKLVNLGDWYWALFSYSLLMAVLSIVSLLLFNPNKAEVSKQNKVAGWLKDVSVIFGRSKVQFFLLFILTLLFYVRNPSTYFVILYIYATLILLDPWKLLLKLPKVFKSEIQQGIGEIFGVQSTNTFLVKLFQNHPSIGAFDFVEFRYSLDGNFKIRKAVVLENYLLNQERWIKILESNEINDIFQDKLYNDFKTDNSVCKINNPEANPLFSQFVGIVAEESTISEIRFCYNSKNEIFEGQLVEVFVNSKKILYQVIDGITKVDQLQHKNETGYVVGVAIQLGIWLSDKGMFEKFGWVPNVNSPVYLSGHISDVPINPNEYVIGNIPNTNYPVILNKAISLTHHTAVLGITGTGKSIFSRNLIRQHALDPDTKIICVDFTGEYNGKLSELNPIPVISDIVSSDCFRKIDEIEKIISGNYNKDNSDSLRLKQEVAQAVSNALTEFLQSDNKLAIFELPEVSNTSGILEYTKCFFKNLFHLAKTQHLFGKKVCLVLEEAHTVIPEWNFSGISDKVSQPLLNSIAQIALQGRKYNVGLLLIAQRTANVSKTVLTQCNTIIAFQELDKTSSEFLSNYIGDGMARILPNLRFRQAIAAGKALRSNVPMVFEVPEITEPSGEPSASIESN